MPLIYCAVPDVTLNQDAKHRSLNPFRDPLDPTKWFTNNNKIVISAAVSSLNPNLPGNSPHRNILNRLDLALRKVASTFEADVQSKNKHFSPLVAHANVFCLMVTDACYDKLRKTGTTNDLFLLEPGEFSIVGIYQAPASGRAGENLPIIYENTFVDAELKAEFLRVCTQAIEEARPTLVDIFKNELGKYTKESFFTLDNKEFPQISSSSSPITASSKQKHNTVDPVIQINDIKTKLCDTLEKEMHDLLKRNNATRVDQLNEEKKTRYTIIKFLRDDIISIAETTIREFYKPGSNSWIETYKDQLNMAIKTSLQDNHLDKYNTLEKIGLTLLNIVTILFSPIKRAVTGSWFFSLEGKTKEAVREIEHMVNEGPNR